MSQSPLHYINYNNLNLGTAWLSKLYQVSSYEGVLSVYPSGSRYIGGYTAGSDVDFVVLAEEGICLREHGFTPGSPDEYEDNTVRSWRKGVLNLIVHWDETKYLQTIAATEFCRLHKVYSKEDRYYAHELIKGEHE